MPGVWWEHEGGQGKLPEWVRGPNKEKLIVCRQYVCGERAMCEGEKDRSSLLGISGHRTFAAVGLQKA